MPSLPPGPGDLTQVRKEPIWVWCVPLLLSSVHCGHPPSLVLDCFCLWLSVGSGLPEDFSVSVLYLQLAGVSASLHHRRDLSTPLLVAQCLACSSDDEVLCCFSPASILGRGCIPGSQRWGILIIPACPP